MSKEYQNDECNELKTLKYKTMILNGVPWPENKSSTNLANLDKFLENEKIMNASEPWSKLDKTAKIKKLNVFAENYVAQHNLDEKEHRLLLEFFIDCLNKKKLQRVKDVVYNKETGEIIDIPSLTFNKNNNNFTLKNTDKRVTTLKGIVSNPKKRPGTVKNIKMNEDSDTDNED